MVCILCGELDEWHALPSTQKRIYWLHSSLHQHHTSLLTGGRSHQYSPFELPTCFCTCTGSRQWSWVFLHIPVRFYIKQSASPDQSCQRRYVGTNWCCLYSQTSVLLLFYSTHGFSMCLLETPHILVKEVTCFFFWSTDPPPMQLPALSSMSTKSGDSWTLLISFSISAISSLCLFLYFIWRVSSKSGTITLWGRSSHYCWINQSLHYLFLFYSNGQIS